MTSKLPAPCSTDPFARLPNEILKLIRFFCGRYSWKLVNEFGRGHPPYVAPRRMELHLASISARWCRFILVEKYRKIAISFTNVQRLIETMERLPYVAESVCFAAANLNFSTGCDVSDYEPPADLGHERFWFDIGFDPASNRSCMVGPRTKLMDRVFVDRRLLVKVRAEYNERHLKRPKEGGGWTEKWPPLEVAYPPCEENPAQSLEEWCQYCYIKATNPSQLPWQMPFELYPPDAPEFDEIYPIREPDDNPWRLTNGPAGKGPIEGVESWDDWHRLTAEVIKLCRPPEFMWDACCHPVPQIIIDALTSYDSLEMFSCWSDTAEEHVPRESYIAATYRPLVATCESLEFATDVWGDPTYIASPEHEVLIELLTHAKKLKHLHLGPSDQPVTTDGRLVPLFSTLHSLDVCLLTLAGPKEDPIHPRRAAMTQLRSVLLDKASSHSPDDLRLDLDAVLAVAGSEVLRPIEEDLRAHAAEVVERWNASDRGPASKDPRARRLRSSYDSYSTQWFDD